jgi:hypothetical protein
MNSRELLAIAIKIFGLWLLAQLFVHVASFSPMLLSLGQWQDTTVPTWAIWLVSASFLVSGLIIAYIIFRLGNSALNNVPSAELPDILSQKFVLQISGIFFVVNSLIHIPSVSRFLFSSTDIELNYYLPLLGYIIQLVIGVLFIVSSSWWAHLLLKLRGRA